MNEISILVAAILSAALASIWYSPLLLGKMWMKSIGLTLTEGELPKAQMLIATVQSVLAQTVFFFVIAKYTMVSMQHNLSIVYLGCFMLLLIGSYTAQSVIWEKRPISYFLIQVGYMALSLFGGIAVIAFWPW